MAVIAAYMLNINLTSEEIDKLGTTEGGSLWTAAISLLLFIYCVIKLRKEETTNNINQ